MSSEVTRDGDLAGILATTGLRDDEAPSSAGAYLLADCAVLSFAPWALGAATSPEAVDAAKRGDRAAFCSLLREDVWSWFCVLLQEDDARKPTPQESACSYG